MKINQAIVIATAAVLATLIHTEALSPISSVTLSPPESLDGSNLTITSQTASYKSALHGRQFGDTINDIQIECNSDNIVVTLVTNHGFNGMIYPKGLSKNSTCMTEYHQTSANITYYLPLRSCNTMSMDVEDGVEYYNTVMVQPHRRLVTNQGRGYHIKCRYQTKERTITNQEQQLNVNLTQSTPSVVGSASMPSCSMKIYSAHDLSHEVAAENVRIGDELHLMISLDDQDVYGMLVTNCLVRDGMNWGEQPLIDDEGCPVDEEIMPQFVYSQNLSRASVTFQAHKFPYTSSVYYQCNVRLCFREGGCKHIPPACDKRPSLNYKEANNEITARHKRWVDAGEIDGVASDDLLKTASADSRAMSIEVFSGLHVDESEAVNAGDKDPMMAASTNDDLQETSRPAEGSAKRQNDREFCMELRKFAIWISLASLLLMAAIILMIACMIQRRKRRRLDEARHHPYDYRTPYSNNAYCRE